MRACKLRGDELRYLVRGTVKGSIEKYLRVIYALNFDNVSNATNTTSHMTCLACHSAADKEVFLRQVAGLKEQLAEVDIEAFERMRRALGDMAKELASNNDKMGAFNMVKEQLDAMEREQAEMQKKLEESLLQIRETERLRAEAVAEAKRARREIEEKEILIKELEEKTRKQEEENNRLNDELTRANEKNARIQQLLDESRKNEAFLKQKISAMEQEHADNMEQEQSAQEELQNQIEVTREKMRAAKKERDKADKQLEDYKANAESGSAELVATKVGIAEEKVRRGESRSDELRKRVLVKSTNGANTHVRNFFATNFLDF